MNIIKFKDTFKSGDTTFNKYFRGKYCWWVNCKWAVLFNVMTTETYITASSSNSIPTGISFLETENYTAYIDEEWTERINNQVNVCKQLNEFVTDIPIAKLKVFRTWLAQSLIDLAKDIDTDNVDSHGYGYETDKMLNYYASTMIDDVVAALAVFASTTSTSQLTTSQCSCSQSTSTILQNQIGTSTCNSLTNYQNGIYNKMVEVFSDINFWVPKAEFCIIFKQYIDAILASGLTLSQTDKSSDYCDCVCANKGEESLRSILSQLSQALQYIIDGEVTPHKNFIYQSFYSWASKLYENMYWL